MLATDDFEHLYRIKEVAKILRISDTKAWQIIKNGEMKAIRIGEKRIVVRKSDLLRYVEKQEFEGGTWKEHARRERGEEEQKIKAVSIS